jgi:hypothetical protein
MPEFMRIRALGEAEEKKILEKIEACIAARKKDGLLSDRDIREIEEMRLHTLPDIQDVQSVYENHLFSSKD